NLDRLCSNHIKSSSPGLVAPDHFVEAPLECSDIERTASMNGYGFVVKGRHAGSHLSTKPHLLLSQRQRWRAFSNPLGDCRRARNLAELTSEIFFQEVPFGF